MSLDNHPEALRAWRLAERKRLVAQRMALDAPTRAHAQTQFDQQLSALLATHAGGVLGLCWPFRHEHDARHLGSRWRARVGISALPVVLARGQPLQFRAWVPGDAMQLGVYDIPFPAHGTVVTPSVLLVPMNGFDAQGYRLGYGGGFFDRTLAALRAQGHTVCVIGVAFEFSRLTTIYPQHYDLPMDWIVTETTTYAVRHQCLVAQPAR